MTQEKLAPATAPAVTETPRAWTRRHLLDVDDFAPTELEAVMQTADAMKEVLGRDVPRVPALRGKTIVTLFYEASTRTRASFELAGKALGADVINISAGGSSVEKGESLIDTVRTLQAVGADVLVMRHWAAGGRKRSKNSSPVSRSNTTCRRRRSRYRACTWDWRTSVSITSPASTTTSATCA